jgi:hypothetical protein
MTQDVLHFDVTGLNVSIEEGFTLNWQGRDIESGRVVITLDGSESQGTVDYASGNVVVEFHVEVTLQELADVLSDMGAEPGLAAPVRGVIHSQGVVFEDHCFRLAGWGELAAHPIFNEGTSVEILAPTRCKPDSVSMSGEEIRAALRGGHPVSWNFNPTEKRVVLKLPETLGGYTHTLCLAGSYTLMAAAEGVEQCRDVAA